MPDMKPTLLRISEDAYHSDPCDVPSLSASVAHTLVSKSPAHAWVEHPKLGGKSRKSSKAMDAGTLIHKMLLGVGVDVEIIGHNDYRTKAAKELRDAARGEGKLPMLAHEYARLEDAAAGIRARMEQKGIVLNGESEVTILWTEEARDGTVVQCRGRIDHVLFKEAHIIDLKTSCSAHPDKCASTIYDFGDDIQAAAYRRGLGQVRPELEGRLEFTDLFVELEEPYPVSQIRHAGTMRELGERRWMRAVNLWAKCLRENWWPDYTETPVYVDAKPWHLDESSSF
jgi:PDDEXK-like domain of unknown function (DUF3799)